MKHIVVKTDGGYKIYLVGDLTGWNYCGVFDNYCDAYTYKLLLEN